MLIAALIALPLCLIAGLVIGFARGRSKPRDPWTPAALVVLWLILLLDWRHALSQPFTFVLFPIALILSAVAVVAAALRAGHPAGR